MKKSRLFLLGVATLFLTACTVGTSNNRYIDKDNPTSEDDSITPLKVTFDFNGGTYDSQTTVTFDNVKPTSYWKYVRARLDEGKITSPEHTTFKGFSFAQDDSKIIDDSYVIKEDITVYARYEPSDPHCVVKWLDKEGSTPLAIEDYFLDEIPEFKGTLPYHEGKSFGGWDPEIQPITETDLGTTRQYTAIWVNKKYKVTWLDYDGSLIRADEIEEGGVPIKPSDPKGKSSPFIEYTFDNWAPTVSEEVHNDQIYVATYKAAHIYGDIEAYMRINITDTNKDFKFKCTATSNITIDWGDGKKEQTTAGTIFHEYKDSGEYSIRIFNPITTISVSPDDNTLIRELYLGKDVTSIDKEAFLGCTNLKTVDFEDQSQLKSIGESAFNSCSSLTSIIIPNTVESINYAAFRACSNLKIVVFEDQSQLTSIGEDAFYRCTNLKTVDLEINHKLKSIGNFAFSACSSLTSITIPNTVESINHSAFSACSNLKTVDFEDQSQLKSIGESAFNSCSSLTSITIPNTVESINLAAFGFCLNLKTVDFGDQPQLKLIGDFAFSTCSSLTSIIIPNTVTSIGDEAFSNCSQLDSVDFTAYTTNDTIPSYNSSAFLDCLLELKFHVTNDEMKDRFIGEGWPAEKIIIDN